ncbi:Crp/Fnr family transcriptional regulator [Chryseobacterium shigense]|uniref:Crp/Fnr family transcriptional regulator n=1 Tax=Chryseobacterium shigense TaxID=297244 RepID=UPI001E50494E|nr:Crp/Fnr family transcriptional regulator [Chryseobacterium shigense]
MNFFKKQLFKKHYILVSRGAVAPLEYFVVKGLLKSTHTDSEGKVQIMQFAYENWWISDMQSFNTGAPAQFDIDCLEDTTVFSISHEDKEDLCRISNKMQYFFRRKAVYNMIALHKRVLMLLSSTASERYEALLKQYPQLHERVSKKLIAGYLGVTRETLSRLSTT